MGIIGMKDMVFPNQEEANKIAAELNKGDDEWTYIVNVVPAQGGYIIKVYDEENVHIANWTL